MRTRKRNGHQIVMTYKALLGFVLKGEGDTQNILLRNPFLCDVELLRPVNPEEKGRIAIHLIVDRRKRKSKRKRNDL